MDNLYKLRTDFAIIGLTGRSGAGCSKIAERLSKLTYIDELTFQTETKDDSVVDKIKLDICMKYLKNDNNWKPFQVIKYSSVLIYHLLHESCLDNDFEDSKSKIIDYILQSCGDLNRYRFSETDKNLINTIIEKSFTNEIFEVFKNHNCPTLHICLRKKSSEELVNYFWRIICPFAENLLSKLKEFDYPKTAMLIQDLACNLRSFGSVCSKGNINIDNSYTVAETINCIIKKYRKYEIGHGRIVIDSLKNSLELTYFKEKYSGFYCIATNKLQTEADDYKLEVFKEKFGEKATKWLLVNKNIDNSEYKGNEVNSGEFSSPDIENCIQKSDYHIFWSEEFSKYENLLKGETKQSINLDRQLVKFISLLFVPGIITPSPIERNMQIAFNAKVNSGCISRQVGAVITDQSFSVKAIGWNDVARYQIPCNLRNIQDLINDENSNHFSDFEKGINEAYSDGKSFKEKIRELNSKINHDDLNGRTCAFCFKSCHNAFEGKDNQVHTRSLHAEENAMLQITKYGGQGVKDGILFTTASPCELCSKKAFQLGIKTIYYIDPYPGIAGSHILTSASNKDENPLVKMFRGAVGRAFHKLYEPFMSYKDELFIRTKVKPEADNQHYLNKLTYDQNKQELIKEILNS